MLLTLLPLAGWAADVSTLDLVAANKTFGTDIDVTELLIGTDADKDKVNVDVNAYQLVGENYVSTGKTNVKNLAIGTYYVKISGKAASGYEDTYAYLEFLVVGKPLTVGMLQAITAKDYTGSPITFATTNLVKDGETSLVEGTDYTATFTNNTNAGTTATITYKGKGNYSGEVSKTFTINAKAFTTANITVTVSDNEVTYDGTATQTATVVVADKTLGKLKEDVDYTVAYSGGHKDFGNYDITVTGKGNYTGVDIVADKQLKIGKATILATPKATKVYDGTTDLPAVAKNLFEYTGFVDDKTGDNVVVGATEWESDVNLKKDVKADYVLKVKEGKNYLTVDDNYIVIPQVGTLAITPKATDIYANDQTVGYGASINAHDVTLSAVLAEDQAAVKAAVLVYQDGAALKVKADPAATDANKKVLANYNPTYNKNGGADKTGTLTTTKGTITIALSSKVKLTKEYDGTAPTITEDLTDKANNLIVIGDLVGDDQLVLTGLTATVDAANGNVNTDPGYKVTLSGATVSANADKYTINYVTTYYKVTKKALTVTVNPQSTKVGTAEATAIDYTLFKVDGLVGNDKQAEIFELTLDPEVVTTAAINDTHEGETGNWIKLGEKVADAAANYSGWNDATGKLTIVAADVIILDDTKDLKTLAASGVDQTITFTSRELKKGTWTTMVLPFDVSVKKLSRALGYAVVDMFDANPASEDMNFKLYMYDIPAYTPFLVKIDEDKNLNSVIIDGVRIKALDEDALVQSNKSYNFIGKMDNEAIATDFWAVGKKMTETDFLFNKYRANTKLAALRAYITAKAGVNAAPNIFIEEPDGTVTAINSVTKEAVNMVKDGWYTISGMKIQGVPTEKGIYIQNGKKVVLK